MLESLAHVAQIAGGLALFIAAAAYIAHRRQLNFSMVMTCNQRFQEMLVDLENGSGAQGRQVKKRYIDLCNEQIFYISSGYLPREVIEEWLDGMLDYLPLFDDKTDEVRPDHIGVVERDLLDGYPTIKKVFTVERTYGVESPARRMALVRRVGKKAKPESLFIVLWRDIRDHFNAPNRREGMMATTAGDKDRTNE